MMQKKDNIARASTGIILVVLLVLIQFSAIFSKAICDDMRNHAQKEARSCCHSDLINVSMSSSQVCSVSPNRVVEYPAVKTQLKRSSASKVLSSNTLYHMFTSALPSQYGSFFYYSSTALEYKEKAIYLLESISLS